MSLSMGTGVLVEGPVTALGVLRQRTRAQHEKIEGSIDLQGALRSREGYRRLLEGYLGLYRPYEALLAGQTEAVREIVAWPLHARVPLLERDLSLLGASVGEIAAVPESEGLPDLRCEDAMLGALYVVEGSQLGGQYIYRQIEEKLGLDEDSGAAFFFGSGSKTGGEWKRFTALLDASVKDAEVAAEAACGMFEAFGSWLGRPTDAKELV